MGHNLCMDSKGKYWLYNTVADGFSVGGDTLPGIEMSYLAINHQETLDGFRWLLKHICGKSTPYTVLKLATIHARCKNLIHYIEVPTHIAERYKTRGKTICRLSGLFSSQANAENAINANFDKYRRETNIETRIEPISEDLFWAWIRW